MELRKSSYTISVKLEREEGKHMLVHGYMGAIDVVSQNVVDYLDSVGRQQPGGAQVSEATLEALKARGYLTPKTNEEEVEHVRKLANLLHQKNKKLHKSFLFLVAYDCNFRCPYCYESRVLKNSRQWTKKVFTKEMVDRAYEAMLQVEPERKLHSPKIALYGGEPLLAQNREIVEYIVQKGAALGYSFMAVTNGYDLDAFEELLGPGKIEFLQITVDGVKDTHDRRRVHYQTKTSFDKIVANIGMALKQDTAISIRVNTDANNFDELPQLEQIFKESGYIEYPKFSMHSSPVVNYFNQTQGKAIDFLNQTDFELKHKNMQYKYKCSVSLLAETLYKTVKEKKRLYFSSAYCSAQVGMYILDPFGELYSCWEDVGNRNICIGNYLSNSIEWTNMLDLWHNQNIANSDKCADCKYAFFCKGGCIARGTIQNGKFSNGFCNDFPSTFESAANLMHHYYLSNENNCK